MTAVGVDRPVRLPFARVRLGAIGIAALIMTVMVIPELGYVPIWDGRVYANCVVDSAFAGISMETLRCAGHPSQGWAIWLAIPQAFAPGSVAALHLTNLVLGIVAIGALRVVLARAFPDPVHARGLDLVAIAAAAHPVIMSTLLQPNVDFGVYVWFFVTLAGLLSPGAAALTTAIVGGVFLVFSKETGVLAYGFAVAAALAIEKSRNAAVSNVDFVASRLKRIAAFVIPVGLFTIHVILWDRSHQVAAIWKHGWQRSAADAFNFFDLSEPVFRSYAAGLFILGFMWVAWLPVAADGLRGLARLVKQRPNREVPGSDEPVLNGLTVLTIALTYVLTAFRTWSNLRYFALLYPLFLLIAYAALVRMGIGERRRNVALYAVIVLFIVAAYRSVDPLSRAVYGTFDAGQRRMYSMTSITGEFEGPGRDQLVYNLEFTGYHHVQDEFFRQVKPANQTVIGTSRRLRWNIWSMLDSATFERTMRREGIVIPTYADEVDIAVRRDAAAWFLEFSNRSQDDKSLTSLLPSYRVTDSITVFARGQRMVARHLVRREAAGLP